MKNDTNSRRGFLTATLTGAAVIGAGAILNPFTALAQTGNNATLKKIALLGTASLQTSQLALSKATNAQVKLFAKFEAAEQEAVGKLLKDAGITVPAPSPEGTAILSKLKSLSGAAFDKAFIQAQVDTHQKLFAVVSSLAGNNARGHVAGLALTTIAEHTERGQLLLTQLG